MTLLKMPSINAPATKSQSCDCARVYGIKVIDKAMTVVESYFTNIAFFPRSQ